MRRIQYVCVASPTLKKVSESSTIYASHTYMYASHICLLTAHFKPLLEQFYQSSYNTISNTNLIFITSLYSYKPSFAIKLHIQSEHNQKETKTPNGSLPAKTHNILKLVYLHHTHDQMTSILWHHKNLHKIYQKRLVPRAIVMRDILHLKSKRVNCTIDQYLQNLHFTWSSKTNFHF